MYYSVSGNTRKIAQKIQERTKADLYEVELVGSYASTAAVYRKILLQWVRKKLPVLKKPLPPFGSYDLIFVGSLVWAWTLPAPLLSFLSQSDFKNIKSTMFFICFLVPLFAFFSGVRRGIYG
ncbi:hypothetical protein AGMMS49949_03490 [Alphaproteobacteria bacterium]|nr:hypothetical protein AGMMS49949_03490 [Alphaproteobacteria bacterium]GHS96768.1 hypothetical protein AGMMS50296_3210 [Alphaproteobacteria bacterium]